MFRASLRFFPPVSSQRQRGPDDVGADQDQQRAGHQLQPRHRVDAAACAATGPGLPPTARPPRQRRWPATAAATSGRAGSSSQSSSTGSPRRWLAWIRRLRQPRQSHATSASTSARSWPVPASDSATGRAGNRDSAAPGAARVPARCAACAARPAAGDAVISGPSRTAPPASRADSPAPARRGHSPPRSARVMSQHPPDDILLARRQVDLRVASWAWPSTSLHVGQRQRRVLGHPVGRGVSQRVQRRRASPPGGRPARTCGARRDSSAGGTGCSVHHNGWRRPAGSARPSPPGKPQPHERVSRRGQLLHLAGCPCGPPRSPAGPVDAALGRPTEAPRREPRSKRKRHQRPVPV